MTTARLQGGTPAFVPPRLAVGDYVLRPFRIDDAAAWSDYLGDPRVTEHTSWPPITSDLIADLVRKTMADYEDLTSLRWALARSDDDTLVGSCGFNRWMHEQATAELAYDLAPAYWGFGLMSAAARAAVAWALGPGSLRCVEAFVMTTNARSISVLERTGLQREGMLSGHRVARGVPRDFYLYSVGQRTDRGVRC